MIGTLCKDKGFQHTCQVRDFQANFMLISDSWTNYGFKTHFLCSEDSWLGKKEFYDYMPGSLKCFLIYVIWIRDRGTLLGALFKDKQLRGT